VHYTSPQEDTSHEPRPGKTYAQLVPAKDESRDQLFQAMNDYSTMFQNLKYAERYEKLRERLSDWPARPELPERRWPRDGEDSGT